VFTVKVNISFVNHTSDTINLFIECEAPYDNVYAIALKIQMLSTDTVKSGNCSEVIQFDHLQSNEMYYFSNEWNHCLIGDNWKFSTASSTSTSIPTWLISVIGVVVFIAIFITIAVIIIVICCIKCTSKSERVSDNHRIVILIEVYSFKI